MRVFKSRASYVLVFIGALALHSWNITQPSLWWDEAATKSSFRHGWTGINAITLHIDVVHKFYYQIAYLVRLVFGDSILALRLPSAVAAALACVAIIELCRQLGLRTSASYAAAVFLAFTPRLFWASLEARSYSMTTLTGILVLLAFVVAIKRSPRFWPWAVFTAVFVFSTYLYVYQLLMVIPLAAFLLLRRSPRRVWLWATGSVAVVVAVAAPLVWTAAHQQTQIAWNRLVALAIPGLIGSQAFMNQVAPFVVFVVAVVAMAWVSRRSSTSKLTWLALVWIHGPTLTLMSASLLGEELYNSRYVSFTLAGWALLLAVVVSGLGRSVIIGWVALLLVVAVEVPSFAAMRGPTEYGSDWGIAAAKLERVARPGEAVIFGDAWHYPILRVSVMEAGYPQAFRGLTQIGLRRDPNLLLDDRITWHKMAGRIDGFKTVWLILDSRSDQQEIGRAAKVLGATGYVEGAVVKAPLTWLVPFRKQAN